MIAAAALMVVVGAAAVAAWSIVSPSVGPSAGPTRTTCVTMPGEAVTILISPRTDAGRAPRVVVPLPEETALFYARWVEREEGERSARMQTLRDTLATSGPVLCEDIDLGAAPAGRVPACVPFEDRAQALFVTDPRAQCGR